MTSYDPSAHPGDTQQCVKCPAPSTTVVTGAMACNTCNEGFFFSPFAVSFPLGTARCDNLTALAAQCQDEDDPACFNQCCLKCEKGMNCEKPANNTLQALAIEDGYWRDTVYSHDVYPCEYTDSCKAGACTTGHTGVACRVCEAGYHYSSVDGRCIELCGNQTFTARSESPRRPPRHRRDACSMVWRCRFLTARPSPDGRVIAEK